MLGKSQRLPLLGQWDAPGAPRNRAAAEETGGDARVRRAAGGAAEGAGGQTPTRRGHF